VPERLARLADFHRRDATFPGPTEVLDDVTRRLLEAPASEAPRLRAVRHAVLAAGVRRLLAAASQPQQVPAARAALESALERMAGSLERRPRAGGPADREIAVTLAADIRRWLARPAGASGLATPPPELPPGPPIGAAAADGCEADLGRR